MNHDSFVSSLLDSNASCPKHLFTSNNGAITERFSVYRNNVMVSLINALADTFPVVHQLVGGEFFNAMAAYWIPKNMPNSAALADYGHTFPDFIDSFPPAKRLPYLQDIAKIEWAYVKAFHSADMVSLRTKKIKDAISHIHDLTQLKLILHPSLAIYSSDFAIHSLWAAHQHTEFESLPNPYQAESILIIRTDLEVHVIKIDTGAYQFIHQLLNSATIEKAMEHAIKIQSDFDISQILTLLIENKAICEITVNEVPCEANKFRE